MWRDITGQGGSGLRRRRRVNTQHNHVHVPRIHPDRTLEGESGVAFEPAAGRIARSASEGRLGAAEGLAAFLGHLAATAIGMNSGGAAVFGAMVGSASYIAAPAAVRIALPQASPGIYLTMALGITFPFNLAIGIPIFLKLAQTLTP